VKGYLKKNTQIYPRAIFKGVHKRPLQGKPTVDLIKTNQITLKRLEGTNLLIKL